MIRNRSFRIAVLFSALVFLILLLTMGLTGLITVLVSESNFIDAPPKELTLLYLPLSELSSARSYRIP